MKKLVLMFAAVAAISFASCENAQKPAEEATDSVAVADSTDSTAVDSAEVEADSVAADTAAAE